MRKLFTILVLLGVVTCPVFAGSITEIPTLFNTGAAGGTWLVNGNPTFTVTSIPAGWAANNAPTSSWISFQADQLTGPVDGASAAPVYNYTTTFTVPSTYILSTVQILGRWSLDDYGKGNLNSVVTPFSDQLTIATHYSQAAFASQTFTISGLTLAANTLTFAVNNKWIGLGNINPTGLQVQFTGFVGTLAEQGGQIPEPGTLVLLGGGLLALGFFRRRR